MDAYLPFFQLPSLTLRELRLVDARRSEGKRTHLTFSEQLDIAREKRERKAAAKRARRASCIV